MSRYIAINKNQGIIYDGFLLPRFSLKAQESKSFRGVAINKPGTKTFQIAGEIDQMINAIDNDPQITQDQLNEQYVFPYFAKLARAEAAQQFVPEIVEEMKLEFNKDITEQTDVLAYSAQNQVKKVSTTGAVAQSALNRYQQSVRRDAAKGAALAKAGAEKDKALKKARAALRGARAAGKATSAGSISQEEAQQLQSDLDGIKQALGSGAYKTLSDGVMKKYLDSQGNVKPNLRPADATQFKQLIDTENEKLNQQRTMMAAAQAAAPAAAPRPSFFSTDDSDDVFNSAEEYEAPDSKTASAAVAPVAANLNVAAGSAAPPPPGQPPRPRQPILPVPAAAAAPPPVDEAQARQDAESAEQLRQAGLRNIAQPPPPPSNIPTAEGQQQEGMTAEDRSQNISLQVSEQEKGDSGTKADDNLDVSKYGYDKQVSMFAIQEDRDFTYSQTLVKAQNPNPKDGLMEALKMWGYTIEINKPKTNDEAEALEIRTFIFLAKEKYALQRQWKRALTQLPEALDDIGFSGQQTATATTGTGQQMGIITQFADPQVLANLVNQAQAAGQPPPPPPTSSVRRGRPPSLVRRPSADAAETKDDSSVSTIDTAELERQSTEESESGSGESGSGESESDSDRRRLTGFGRDVGYTNRTDRVGRTERVPQGGQGVQRVRVARPQQARPPVPNMRRLDTRPKMNVKEAQFKMRKSRINPNLLFTNLTKQNPALVGTLPTFKTRASAKPTRRIQF